MVRKCLVTLVAVGLSTASAMAGVDGVRVVTKYAPAKSAHKDVVQKHQMNDGVNRSLYLVQRPIADRAVIVSRALSIQPVREDLIEVQLPGTTVYLDPHKNYIRRHINQIDENHFIPKAQRLAAHLRARGVQIVQRDGVRRSMRLGMKPEAARPYMIIVKPRPNGLNVDEQGPMPTVPTPKKVGKQLVRSQ